MWFEIPTSYMLTLKFPFFFAFVLSYKNLFEDLNNFVFWSLAKSLIQAKTSVSHSPGEKKDSVLQKCLLITPFRFHLIFKYSLVCCVCVCSREGKMMLVTPQVIEYHEIPAEMISQQIPGYHLTPSENAESSLKEGSGLFTYHKCCASAGRGE